MIQLLIGSLILGQAAKAPVDLRFMQHAAYFAKSIADPTAPGGFGGTEDGSEPEVVSIAHADREGVQAFLFAEDKRLKLALVNGGKKEQWLRAGDSDILGYLQAKDNKGVWQPIEYHWFYGCGNSLHRIQLPPMKLLMFKVPMPSGSFKTSVRWHYKSGKEELNSNELTVSIPRERFMLPPALQSTNELRGGDNPTLYPKPH
jgi:hypothetical protein